MGAFYVKQNVCWFIMKISTTWSEWYFHNGHVGLNVENKFMFFIRRPISQYIVFHPAMTNAESKSNFELNKNTSHLALKGKL